MKKTGSDGREKKNFYLKIEIKLKGGMSQLMYLKPRKTTAIKI